MSGVCLISTVMRSLDYFRDHDFYTYRHILMVFALSTLLARELLEDRRTLIREVAAGPVHDFGKICIPLEVLRKTSPLSAAERKMMEHHAPAGYVLLSYYYRDQDNLYARVARNHHERRNGSGYPSGIMLDDPIVEIVVVSDIYDALISPRP
jgi:HD-GYP domain-containing protein (c-di-GMP phosphodiesterase class II)